MIITIWKDDEKAMKFSASRQQRYLLCGFAFLLCFLLVIPIALHPAIPADPLKPVLRARAAATSDNPFNKYSHAEPILLFLVLILCTVPSDRVRSLVTTAQFRIRASIPVMFKQVILSPIKFTSVMYS